MNKRLTGSDKEELATKYLQDNGMTILERNFRVRAGEIDIIGRHEGYLVFVEVKYRSTSKTGMALEAVDYRKQKQIIKVSDFYRTMHKLGMNTAIRYDVVAIQGSEVVWVKNAFSRGFF